MKLPASPFKSDPIPSTISATASRQQSTEETTPEIQKPHSDKKEEVHVSLQISTWLISFEKSN